MNRKNVVFAVLGAFFLTNAIVAEMIGGKVVYVGPESWTFGGRRLAASIGVVPWPVVFLTTDLINEYFGRRGVRRLTWLAVAMIAYAFVVLAATRGVPAAPFGVPDDAYDRVFGQSQWIIVGSILAFVASQLVDVSIFRALRGRTGPAMLWARATGSTVVSQMIDSVVVLYVGLAVPNGWSFAQFLATAVPNYLIKLAIALAMTPAIYLAHAGVERYLGRAEAHAMAAAAARDG